MAKIITGLNSELKDLDGTVLKGEGGIVATAKSIIAQNVRRASNIDQRSGNKAYDALRAEEIAHQIYKANDKIELEDADYEMVKKIIDEAPPVNNMAKALALGVLNKTEEKK
jgi:hypothetical protein